MYIVIITAGVQSLISSIGFGNYDYEGITLGTYHQCIQEHWG